MAQSFLESFGYKYKSLPIRVRPELPRIDSLARGRVQRRRVGVISHSISTVSSTPF